MKLFIGWLMVVLCACGLYPLAASAQDEHPHVIAFTDGDIYTVDVDSGLVTRLVDIDGAASDPVWSPDGTRIAYRATLGSDFYGYYGLYVMDADGSHSQQLVVDLVWRSQPVWIDDGAAILYGSSSAEKGGDCVLKVVNMDGGEPREVLRKPHTDCNVSGLNPVLSPDGNRIVFAYDEPDGGTYLQLYVMTLSTGQVDKLTDNRANHNAPAWSPDGTQIAYTTNQDKQREIYVMNADGSSSRRLTHRPGNDGGPHWLPDGQHIIFASDQNGYNVFSLDVTTGDVRNLTNLVESGAWNVTVSPDGKQIAYATGRDPVGGSDHISVMTLATGDVRVLEGVPANAYAMSWRPE